MGSAITMTIRGDKQLQRALRELPKKAERKVVRQAVRKGAKGIQQQLKANVRSMVGGKMGRKIARAFIVRRRKAPRGVIWDRAIISPKYDDDFAGVTKDGKDYYIPAALEYGHAFPGRGGRGAPKDVAAIPFTRKAFEEKAPWTRFFVIGEIKKGIFREAKLLAR